MKNGLLMKLTFNMLFLLFLKCGIVEELFKPHDDMGPGIITPPIPICSEDSIIIQKILDTNNLKLKLYDVAYAAANNRVTRLKISGSVWDTNSMVDTLCIPEQICQLDSLKELFLRDLRMNYMKIPLKASKVSNVYALLLSSNKLKRIPENLSFFERLENVKLDRNLIDTIKSLDINCQNIKWLNLEENKIIAIPSDVYMLSNLVGLYLANNNIENIPFEISQLDSLSVLSLRNNMICNPPDSIVEMLNKLKFGLGTQNCK